jgi:hypothetical protein
MAEHDHELDPADQGHGFGQPPAPSAVIHDDLENGNDHELEGEGEDEEDDDEEDLIAVPPNPDDAQSLLDQIKEQREDLKSGEHRLELDVPGYNGMLVVRYKPVRWDVIEQLTKKVRKDKSGVSKNVLASTDTIIEACEEVLLRVNGELTSIPTGQGGPVQFDSRLASALSFEAETARQVVAGVFPNEMGVIDHNVRYSRWLRDVTKEVDDDLLGE